MTRNCYNYIPNRNASMSVQANRFAYCSPRSDRGPYTTKEVGFITDSDGQPMSPPKTWRQPAALIEKFIAAHGGAI